VTIKKVLKDTQDAVKDKEGNRHSDMFFMELLQNRKVGNNPDVLAWVESLFSDQEREGRLKAA
jgi:hypothetical protein